MKNRHKGQKTTIIILISIVIVIGIYICVTNAFLKELLITLISLVAAIAVFIQIKGGTDVARAEFIMNLQDTYTSTDKFTELFSYCWNNYNNQITYQEMATYLEKPENKRVLLNYLTFFESVYLMKEQGILKLNILDELFGRRFFIVINNKAVQDLDLVKNFRYYQNIYYLYTDWSTYRIKNINKKNNIEEEKQKLFLNFTKEQSKNNEILPSIEVLKNKM